MVGSKMIKRVLSLVIIFTMIFGMFGYTISTSFGAKLKAQGTLTVTTKVLRVREKATTNSKVLGHVYKNDRYYYYRTTKGWAMIKYKGRYAWVSRKYVSFKSKGRKPYEKGIDVSKWNGNVDFKKVKADGIDFVIIRAGYGFGHKDKWFERNYKKAKAAGLKVGTYWYSYADSKAEAVREADACMAVIKGKTFEYPVYFDIEEKKQLSRGRTFCSNLVTAFCDRLSAKGYYPGFYASKSTGERLITNSVKNKYAFWVAQWGRNLTYRGKYGLWQYTDSGRVNGIKGKVDMNYSYVDYRPLIKKAKKISKPAPPKKDLKPQGTLTVTTKVLRVREKATTNSRIVGRVYKNNRYYYYRTTRDWAMIKYKGRYAWVHRGYVSMKPNGGKKPAPKALKALGTLTVTTKVLRVREKAITKSRILGRVYKNNRYHYYKTTRDWAMIKYKGRYAWVHRGYVSMKPNGGKKPAPKAPKVQGTLTVTTKVLRVREKATTNSRILGRVYKNNRYHYYRTTRDWAMIKYKGRYAWVHKRYVSMKPNGGKKPAPKGPKVQGTITVTARVLRVRQKATTKSRIVGRVYKYDRYHYYKLTKDWVMIKYKGKYAWVSRKYVTFKKLTPPSTKGFAWPVRGRITSRFGWRRRGFHRGLDIAARTGTPIRASKAGTVYFSGWKGGYGNVVMINHGNGVTTRYAHNSRLLVRRGQKVRQGQKIALAGSTGRSTGPHCHFEIRINGKAVNPQRYLKR